MYNSYIFKCLIKCLIKYINVCLIFSVNKKNNNNNNNNNNKLFIHVYIKLKYNFM
ncbi:hypothetical protein C923_00776 [Plasmodium falciparum UGT5.1]|uniref:Uncharacterized protein n=1 Tax=Plasmodium falciparum UGT5.1 TaxID=1237627 RepID=W7JI73_PLAFA|nr:hypothetical protein C923_00776 [Plasmodium falciparum UGT5.1]